MIARLTGILAESASDHAVIDVGGVGYLFKKWGVTAIEGIGTLVDAHTVEVIKADGSTQKLSTNYIVVATGSVPAKLPIPGIDDADIYTPNWDVKKWKGETKAIACTKSG